MTSATRRSARNYGRKDQKSASPNNRKTGRKDQKPASPNNRKKGRKAKISVSASHSGPEAAIPKRSGGNQAKEPVFPSKGGNQAKEPVFPSKGGNQAKEHVFPVKGNKSMPVVHGTTAPPPDCDNVIPPPPQEIKKPWPLVLPPDCDDDMLLNEEIECCERLLRAGYEKYGGVDRPKQPVKGYTKYDLWVKM